MPAANEPIAVNTGPLIAVALIAGTRLGPYEILTPLGAGPSTLVRTV